MVCRRSLPASLVLLMALILITMVTGKVSAQQSPQIPLEALTAETLSDAQQQQVADYVSRWGEQLMAEEDTVVSEARQRLLNPLRRPEGISEQFHQAYAEAMVPLLEAALEVEGWFSRLNAMIVATRLPADQALPLIRRGAEDENSAVRYWAMKGVQHIADREGWPEQQQSELLDVLTNLLRTEPTSPVVGQVMRSLVDLEDREAMQRTLDALNQRASAHHAEPGRSLSPEHTGLEQLFVRLIAADEADPRTHELRELARTASLYMRVAAVALDEEVVPENNAPAYRSIIRLADRVLREAHSNLNSPQNLPEAVDSMVRNEQWAGVLVAADQWTTVLQESPFNFTSTELALEIVGEQTDE